MQLCKKKMWGLKNKLNSKFKVKYKNVNNACVDCVLATSFRFLNN